MGSELWLSQGKTWVLGLAWRIVNICGAFCNAFGTAMKTLLLLENSPDIKTKLHEIAVDLKSGFWVTWRVLAIAVLIDNKLEKSLEYSIPNQSINFPCVFNG
jgi:hypothetical protein